MSWVVDGLMFLGAAFLFVSFWSLVYAGGRWIKRKIDGPYQ